MSKTSTISIRMSSLHALLLLPWLVTTKQQQPLLSSSSSLIDYVNPYIGTSFHQEQRWDVHDYGNCNMPVGPPFAHTPWTAQTRANEAKCTSPYYFFDEYWHGMRRTHWMSGSCTIDYGSATILPALQPTLRGTLILHALNHSAETSTPAYYSMNLKETSLLVEASSASRSGIMRVTSSARDGSDDDEGSFYLLFAAFDSRHNKSTIHIRASSSAPSGCVDEIIVANPVHRWYQSKGEYAHFSGYHYFKMSQPSCDFGIIEAQPEELPENVIPGALDAASGIYGPAAAYLKFSRTTAMKEPLEVVTGGSFLSAEKARLNMLAELSTVSTSAEAQSQIFTTVEALRDKISHTWDDKLGMIRAVPHSDGGSSSDSDNDSSSGAAQLTTFYSAVWRSLLLPRIVSDFDGEYLTFGDAARRVVSTADDHFGQYFDDFSMWDIYRAQVPLLNLVYTADVRDMVMSLLVKARHGGWLPIFPAWHSYTDEMIGDHCGVLIADAFLKGVIPLDATNDALFSELLQYLLKNALTVSPPGEYKMGMGRRALQSYLTYGFIPVDDEVLDSAHSRQQVSRTLEYAYDDFVVAQAAQLWLDLKQRQSDWRNASVCQNDTGSGSGSGSGNGSDSSSESASGSGNDSSGVCVGGPELDNDVIMKVRQSLRRLMKHSENFMWVLDGEGADSRASVSSGQRCATALEIDTEASRGGVGVGEDDDEEEGEEEAPTGFVRPRFANYSWAIPTAEFDPTAYYSWLTETSVWQYSFSVPHNVEGMIKAYGGEQKFAAKLDQLFEGGHYNHGNEPDHHALYLYAYIPGHAWKIQHRLPGIVATQYGPTERGLAGNEDAGQMSAWLVLSSIGLYQVCPGCGGDNDYVLGLPLFAHVEVALPDATTAGRTLVIDAVRDPATATPTPAGTAAHTDTATSTDTDSASVAAKTPAYIQRVTWNGCPYECAFFPHGMLTGGPPGAVNRLEVYLGPQPNTSWGGNGRRCIEKYAYCRQKISVDTADGREKAGFYSSFALERSRLIDPNTSDQSHLIPVCGCLQ